MVWVHCAFAVLNGENWPKSFTRPLVVFSNQSHEAQGEEKDDSLTGKAATLRNGSH